MDPNVLEISGLRVAVGDKEIIKGVDLSVGGGEVHVLFGPNGSGKSTLLCSILRLPGYTLNGGTIRIHGTDTAALSTDEIANLGVGMSFQHPPRIRGVTLRRFLENISGGVDLSDPVSELAMEPFLDRELNVGFSGGELKRAEILKLYAQNPDLLLIDEPESGVDIENVAVISGAINTLLQKDSPPTERKRSALIITHTGNILNTVHADVGHVFMDGRIICSGNPLDIMEDIKKGGFSGCIECIRRRDNETL